MTPLQITKYAFACLTWGENIPFSQFLTTSVPSKRDVSFHIETLPEEKKAAMIAFFKKRSWWIDLPKSQSKNSDDEIIDHILTLLKDLTDYHWYKVSPYLRANKIPYTVKYIKSTS